eukprot:scaffold4388_cov206-Amphora_coffeaeformis.AAC.1
MGHPCWVRGWEGPRAWPLVRHLGCRWGCLMGQRSLWGSDWDCRWDSPMGHPCWERGWEEGLGGSEGVADGPTLGLPLGLSDGAAEPVGLRLGLPLGLSNGAPVLGEGLGGSEGVAD